MDTVNEAAQRGFEERTLRPTYQARLKLEAAKEWIAVARHGQSFHREDDEKTVILSEAAEVLDEWIGRLRDIE